MIETVIETVIEAATETETDNGQTHPDGVAIWVVCLEELIAFPNNVAEVLHQLPSSQWCLHTRQRVNINLVIEQLLIPGWSMCT